MAFMIVKDRGTRTSATKRALARMGKIAMEVGPSRTDVAPAPSRPLRIGESGGTPQVAPHDEIT